MNKDILLKVLKLDSLLHKLSLQERVLIHRMRGDKIAEPTMNVFKMYRWVVENHWMPPRVRYGQDFLLYYENKSGEWRPVEELEEILKTTEIL